LVLRNFQKKGAQKAPFFYWIFLLLVLIGTLNSCQIIATIPSDTKKSGYNNGNVKKVIDGDSIELSNGDRIRLKGINAPEKNQYLYKESLSFATSLLDGKKIRIEFDEEDKDQYGRSLGYVFVEDVFVNEEIVRAGLAILFNVPKIGKYKNNLQSSFFEARQNRSGLWQKSADLVRIEQINSNAVGEDEKNVNGEWVLLKNIGKKQIQLAGYILQDESNNQYTFPNYILKENSTVTIYSGKGLSSSEKLYWGKNFPLWNNESDSAILFDSKNKFVDYKTYP
jgi:endonuclease YncB( thermonuclease family)